MADNPMVSDHRATEPVAPPLTGFSDSGFAENQELTDLVNELIETVEAFAELGTLRFVCLWKKEGGKKSGAPALGDVQLAKPLEQWGTEVDVWLWTAQDHVLGKKLNWYQYEALAYHLLCRILRDGEGNVRIIQPPIRAFVSELTRYGPWTETLKAAHTAMGYQLRLDLQEEVRDLLEKLDASADGKTADPDEPEDPDGGE